MSPQVITAGSLLWYSLPNEMRLAVVDALDIEDIKSLSRVDKRTYSLCVPETFKDVTLNNCVALERFLDDVPAKYLPCVQRLSVCTSSPSGYVAVEDAESYPQTSALVAILSGCTHLQQLSLKLAGSLDKAIIPCFSRLTRLQNLTIANCGEEDLSERLIVSIAASVTGLEQLSLDRISRSTMHAPELIGVYPYIPLVTGDDNIPDHPTLGSELSLPSLLRLPTLRKLIIRDTHLGDARWATTPVACHLEVLDLGSCCHENDEFNRGCTERIMAAVGRTVDEFSLTTSVSDAIFAEPAATPLQRLRKLHISPYFPVDSVVETMSTLAGSPIESLSMQCYEDDVVDVCAALEEFLSLRVERGPEFYDKLARIDVSVAAVDFGRCASLDETAERAEARRRLQEFCRDLRLAGDVADVPSFEGNQKKASGDVEKKNAKGDSCCRD